uniref:Pheromone-processing carboxypeptidase KEX1-like n=1 Tax=Nicotiana tabacum TaxID=4097 RepID=A0A1S3Z1Y1_TOBAC|nr:PREDICTED: pheromone-processing carboxypeptidase KEX1-like [Nicotiana tabacum]
MSFKIITLRWYHDGVLIPGNFARYVGGSQTLTLDVDVDLLSLIELMNYTRIYDFQNVAKLYICPMDRTDKLVNILTDKDILDICNELEDRDTLDIYMTHAAPLCVVDINEASKGVEQESGVDSESDFDNSEGEDDNENDSDFDNSNSDESDGVDLHVPDDKDYGSDVHEEFVECRDELSKYRRKRSERPEDKGDISLGDAGVDIGFDELRTGSKQDRYTGLVGADEPYFGSSDAESFPSDAEDEFDEEHKKKMAAKRRKKTLIFDVKKITLELGLIF